MILYFFIPKIGEHNIKKVKKVEKIKKIRRVKKIEVVKGWKKLLQK